MGAGLGSGAVRKSRKGKKEEKDKVTGDDLYELYHHVRLQPA